jgi:hypothetical protein
MTPLYTKEFTITTYVYMVLMKLVCIAKSPQMRKSDILLFWSFMYLQLFLLSYHGFLWYDAWVWNF